MQPKITKSSLRAGPKTLVYRDEISCPSVRSSPRTKASKRSPPLKDAILTLLALLVWKRLQISTCMLLIITSTGHGLFSFINTDDLERPWTFPKRGFSRIFRNFWLQRTFQKWIATKRLEIDQDNQHTKFSALNADFSRPPRLKEAGSRER